MERILKKMIGDCVELDVTEISNDMSLMSDLNLDEFDIGDLLNEIEDYFEIELSGQAECLDSVGDLIAFVKKSM